MGTMESVEIEDCIYCGASGASNCSQTVPSLGDDAAWAELAEEHMDGCEWIATRAHRLDDADEGNR